jgi:hypothetical protein
MLGVMILSFLAGGLFGMMGMAVLAFGSKSNLMHENQVMRQRLNFLEHEDPKKRYTPVQSPKPHVHQLVN